MAKYKVTFMPHNKAIEVDEGLTLLDTAERAGVHIDSVCGGEGLCGECRVQILSGKVEANTDSIGFLSADEIKSGYVLACQTKIKDNLDVFVPAKGRAEEMKIISEGVPAYSSPARESLHKLPSDPARLFEPLVSKLYLQLPEPTLTDNASDISRVTRELGKKLRYPYFETSLSCLSGLAETLRENDWKVTVTVAKHDGMGRILQIEGGDTSADSYGLAVDVGTTTVVVQLVNLKTGKVVGVEGSHNLQARYGEDVISRMIYACNKGELEPVHKAVIANINNLIQTLSKEKGVDVNHINSIVAAGNTTMSHFLLGLMPCAIRLEPYVPTANIYPQLLASEVGININPHGVMEVLPSVASYIGGDTVAGILACGLADGPEVKCLIDVGTNGEIAIGNNDWIACCSASAGPAFEGGGMRWGMRATKGAIERLAIADGRVTYETIGKAKPRGVCGGGLLDALYELAKNKIIGQDGKFNTSLRDKRLIVENDVPQYILALPEETETGEAITIGEPDISNLIKAKGAMFAALKSLTDYVGMSFEQMGTIYLAGGFGNSLDINKAVAIGLLPDVDRQKIQFIGNSSVMGARMALVSVPAFEASINISKKMTNIELSNYQPFMNEFIAALFLPHTDTKLFPSVKF
ncbi:MAG: DUF4445 domain-containing protein [Chloroflexi bacterium]|nr:DUF4445 domain-containing protein [Chloroflexota bacterium]